MHRALCNTMADMVSLNKAQLKFPAMFQSVAAILIFLILVNVLHWQARSSSFLKEVLEHWEVNCEYKFDVPPQEQNNAHAVHSSVSGVKHKTHIHLLT